ncbi:MAG: aspartate kinase [Clostridia bacterium]|nr:aspartate kinase [Clostridia bacterium]
MLKVIKFGGTSLASAEQFRKVAAIVREDKSRRYVVASAPGKRFSSDTKVTDLLLSCYRLHRVRENFDEPFSCIRSRFEEICAELEIPFAFGEDFDRFYQEIKNGATEEYIASRGEHFNAKILAEFLQFPFLDTAEGIVFDENGVLMEEKTNENLALLLKNHTRAVLPGFYGATEKGEVRTFSRGGSDITGSLVARAAKADLYENWTDVSGLLMADPRIVSSPKAIECVTYRELRELSYMGANVLHEDAIFPVRREGIPINIRNTNDTAATGTMIVENAEKSAGIVTGIAGKKGFGAIYIEKGMMNRELGFGRRVLEVLENRKISFEHLPSGIDTMTVVLNRGDLVGHENELIRELQMAVQPDRIHLVENLCLIAVVGRGMINSPGTAARLFGALAKEKINIRMIDQGSSEMNIIVALEEQDYEKALKAIYAEFVPEEEN